MSPEAVSKAAADRMTWGEEKWAPRSSTSEPGWQPGLQPGLQPRWSRCQGRTVVGCTQRAQHMISLDVAQPAIVQFVWDEVPEHMRNE